MISNQKLNLTARDKERLPAERILIDFYFEAAVKSKSQGKDAPGGENVGCILFRIWFNIARDKERQLEEIILVDV